MREGDTYHVFVGDNHIRHYKEDTLPDCIKSRLTMILASPHQINSDRTIAKMQIYNADVPNPDFDEIGWRASDSYFCIILPHQDLLSLKGETIDRRRTCL
jgi:hypothetical protein